MNRQKEYNKYLIREFLLGVIGIILIVLFLLFGTEEANADKCRYIVISKESTWESVVVETVEEISSIIAELKQIKLEESYIQVTDEEYEILCRIVEAEATGEKYGGKLRVCAVILNRVNSDLFKDSIEEVVFRKIGERYQFSPISDGRYYKVPITEETRNAVDAVLKNEFEHGALFFNASELTNSWASNNREFIETYGNHSFYK